jgi:hypothetical protein
VPAWIDNRGYRSGWNYNAQLGVIDPWLLREPITLLPTPIPTNSSFG